MNKRVLRSLIFSACWIGQSYASMPKLEYVKGAVSDAAQWTADSAKQLWSEHSLACKLAAATVVAVGGYMVIVPRCFPQTEKEQDGVRVLPHPRGGAAHDDSVDLYLPEQEVANTRGAVVEIPEQDDALVTLLERIDEQEICLRRIKNREIAVQFEKLLIVCKILGMADKFKEDGYCRLAYDCSVAQGISSIYVGTGSNSRAVLLHQVSKIEQKDAGKLCQSINSLLLGEANKQMVLSGPSVQSFVQSIGMQRLTRGQSLTTELLFNQMDQLAAADR